MKIRFLLNTLFLVSFSIIAQKNNGIVIYKVEQGNKSVLDNGRVNYLFENIDKNLDRLEYHLIFSGQESTFELDKSLISDFDNTLTPAIIAVGKGKYYYKKNTLLLNQKQTLGDLFLIEYDLNDLKWELTTDRKKIGDFECVKAIGTATVFSIEQTNNKKVVAWFAPSINLPFGPKKYVGLPGLIVQLFEDDLKFQLYSIKFGNQKIKVPQKGIKITEKKLNEYALNKAKEYFKFQN
ncbi:Hypothetical protein I595_1429 [Croceitalea dokdonensis DOKDO 023]|uniref:GLPGLI family protein n=1 Tax=Croceitalea dokdonensis DOKDO 023 TaxID=1300341 RepID=A0A0P7AM56_9FLAO|nr:GLPGLI family protein [Croceitalea dokdonensis]KPM33002.1 Hypothetical protein I595_1429 [Croceitalea dokdonensis DOKDO 023]